MTRRTWAANALNVINAALIGFGYAGRTFHAPLIEACHGLALHTVVSSRPEAVAAAYPRAIVASFDEALADPAVDLVVIATPNRAHAPMAAAALAAAKAVIVDKPFTVTSAEAEELALLAARERRLLSVFHNRRWDADFLALRRLIAEDRLGPIVRFESHFDRYRPQVRDRWRETDAPGSGVWYDLGPHLIDQALQLFGAPKSIACDLAVQRQGAIAPDYFHAVLGYDRLRVILHADMLSAASGLRFVVHGERGSWIKEGLDPQEEQLKSGALPGAARWGEDSRPGLLVDGAGGSRTTVAGPPGNYLRYYEAIAAALRGEGDNPVPPGEALAVMRLLEAGVRSHETGSRIEL